MNTRKLEDAVLEDLLRRALIDDLPPDVAAGMQDRLDLLRERSIQGTRRPGTLAFLMPRKAWAVASTLMLMSGGMLQGLGFRSPLADRMSTIGTFQAVSARLASAESMSCTARLSQDDGSYLTCRIDWRGQRGTAILVEEPGETALGTHEVTSPAQITDPLIQPLAPLFKPSGLAELLSGPWRLVRFYREGKCAMGMFRAPDPSGRMDLEFTIDMCAFTPVGVHAHPRAHSPAGKDLWEARLDF